ncbi:Protein of unknown function (DUF2927) [Breoghania corrubedonensis]|uniref:DUF2927 family protein n=1 Tax=Breoghania corrubedonensis TaxID=665038 RepID=A0A2T5VF12_9HYPH|nr:DUF2927 domain-containing protein [Breoghania corrubedonensis]PTW62343.1 Protein of unknown function (DUF2927) [Breoghania corrubedonensis]
MRVLHAALPAALWLALAAPALATPAAAASSTSRFTDRELTNGFLWTVFGLEYRSWSWKPYQVKKYEEPVRFFVINLGRRDRTRDARRFIASLPENVRGLNVRFAADAKSSNFQVYIVDRAQYAQTVREHVYRSARADAPGRCLVRVESGSDGITNSTAVIVSDEGEHLFRRCLVEETLQGLGPMNDDDRLVHSVFNDKSDHDTFTPFDRMIMNMLYDPRIKPGMNARKVEPLLPMVIHDARRRIR